MAGTLRTLAYPVAKWACHLSASRPPTRSGPEALAEDPAGFRRPTAPGAAGGLGEQARARREAAGHVSARLALDEPLDTRLGPGREVALEFVPARGERGPTVQVDHPSQVPRAP